MTQKVAEVTHNSASMMLLACRKRCDWRQHSFYRSAGRASGRI